MLITQTLEAFETTLARACEADRVEITPAADGVILKLWRGDTMVKRNVRDEEMDQPLPAEAVSGGRYVF